MSTLDRFACAAFPLVAFLAQGAAVTSIGVALATWSRRLGRAVAVSVSSYVLVTFGWILCLELVPEILVKTGLIPRQDSGMQEFISMLVAIACPFFSQLVVLGTMSLPPSDGMAFHIGQLIVVLGILLLALAVLALTLATFNRSVGRASERPRRAPRQPGQASALRLPRLWLVGSRRGSAPCPPGEFRGHIVPGTPHPTLKAVPGEAIYDKGGRNLAHLTDRQQFEAENDDGICLRRAKDVKTETKHQGRTKCSGDE